MGGLRKLRKIAEKEAFEYQRTRSWGTMAISLEMRKKKKGGVSPLSISKARVSGGKCNFF